MNTKFINSENSKTFDPHRLLLNLTDKIDLRKIILLFYQILAFTIHGKILKSHMRIINLKYQLQYRMKNFLMDHILYQIFKTILNIY